MRLLALFTLLLPLTATEVTYDAFETGEFGQWQTQGSAFGTSPVSHSSIGMNGQVTNYCDESYVSSAHGGNEATGTLTSSSFKVELPYLSFRIAGGNYPKKTAVQLLIDGKIIHQATGANSRQMTTITWNLQEHLGKTAQLHITDQETGKWGIINVDHFIFSANSEPYFPKQQISKNPDNSGLVQNKIIPHLSVPPGTKVTLFADHKNHQIYSPTAISVSETGEVYLAETHRFRFGVEDNRYNLYWLLDDLASQTTADRAAMHEKWKEKVPLKSLTEKSEKIRILIDNDGDGKADESKIFADEFNNLLDGTAAGIMAFEGDIYFACIPHIWKLQDKDGDHQADKRQSIQDGFGVRVSLSGHDLNGFTLGPDGRIYTTVGDRGFSFTTKEGKKYHYPNQGAILRFETDGSKMEVVHTGLRNPKEIAFDKYGTGISVDNNSDQGDGARVVYFLEGADSGWRMGHQILHSFHQNVGIKKRPINQWMEEKMWEPRNDSQPGHLTPPIGNLTNGPSGLAYYPGTGYDLGCKDQFLICDYRGSAPISGIWNFQIEDDTAAFKIASHGKFNWGAAVTDLEWGYDGKLYVSDFVTGWSSHPAGRVYTLDHQNPSKSSISEIFANTDFKNDPIRTIAPLLGHPDQRVRLRAQLHLADRPQALAAFAAAANQIINPIERLHGIWGLGIMARKHQNGAATHFLTKFLRDNNPRIRGQVVQALGESTLKSAEALIPVLTDGSPRVRALAAIAIGRLKDPVAQTAILEMIAFNGDKDPTLRHAGVMALLGSFTEKEIAKLHLQESEAIRHAAVIALRRLRSPEIINFIGDTNLAIADDVIRAINDEQIEAARSIVAALLDDPRLGTAERPLSRMIVRRILASTSRLPQEKNIKRLMLAAANKNLHLSERLEAMHHLSHWTEPHPIDRSLGQHLPLKRRDRNTLQKQLTQNFHILTNGGEDILAEAMQLASKHQIKTDAFDEQNLLRMLRNTSTPEDARVTALELIANKKPTNLGEILTESVTDPSDLLANTALKIAADQQNAASQKTIQTALNSPITKRRQAAWAILADYPAEFATPHLLKGLDSLTNRTADPLTQLDIILAAKKRTELEIKTALIQYQDSLDPKNPLAKYQPTLAGGDPVRGLRVFTSHAASQCFRCHHHEQNDGTIKKIGPNLMDIGLKQDAETLLESLMLPNKKIAGNNSTLTASAMPSMQGILKDQETRDLIAWLLTLKTENPEK